MLIQLARRRCGFLRRGGKNPNRQINKKKKKSRQDTDSVLRIFSASIPKKSEGSGQDGGGKKKSKEVVVLVVGQEKFYGIHIAGSSIEEQKEGKLREKREGSRLARISNCIEDIKRRTRVGWARVGCVHASLTLVGCEACTSIYM